MCSICIAGTQPAPCKELQVVLTDCYPAICDRVCQMFLFCFAMKHSAHCAHVHNVRSAYVNNALTCRRPWRCSSSSSIVCIVANGIDSLTAISIESLLKYPWGDNLILLAKISSFSSDFGSRPVHNRNSGLLGSGALMVPLPTFLSSLITTFSGNVHFWDFQNFVLSIVRYIFQLP